MVELEKHNLDFNYWSRRCAMKKNSFFNATVYFLFLNSLFMSGCVMAQNDQTAEFLNNHPLLNRNRIAEFKKKLTLIKKLQRKRKPN